MSSGSGRPPEEDVPPRPAPITLFVSDPSAEAERIIGTLRARGYVVVDVPLSMLVARVAVQRPRVILLDADGDGALACVARMRELPECEAIDVVFMGRAGAALADAEDALAHEGSGFFARPVDVIALLRKIESLTGGAVPRMRTSAPPASTLSLPSLPPASMRHDAPGAPVIPRAPGSMPRVAPPPPSLPSLGSEGKRSVQAQVSNELEQLLAEAEQRVGGQIAHESLFPSPDEELAQVLPADILASLDEPIDDEDVDDASEQPIGALSKGTTSGGSRQQTTGGGPHGPRLSNRVPATEPPGASKTHGGTVSGLTTGSRNFTEYAMRSDAASGSDRPRPGTMPPPTTHEGHQELAPPPDRSRQIASVPAAREELPPRSHGPLLAMASGSGLGPTAPMPSVLAPGDAARALAHAITTRATGALCFESQEGMRRAVLREGDLVTAASGVDSESLLAFLVGRGDLARDQVEKLVGRLPLFGRHAGAALVAHGHLRQDQLWPVLRAHAEWVLGRAIQLPTGTAMLEPEPPGRLRAEPSVFGGSTGAEIFVELVRRVVPPDEAITRLGGAGSRLADGPNAAILAESGLETAMMDRLTAARGGTIKDLVSRSSEPDIAAIVHALHLLGVFETIRTMGELRPAVPAESGAIDTLDEDAVRARVHARLLLVEEGDYFALLGVTRDATGYEVRRAFLELRRAFEPTRILTPQIADLSHDVRKIAIVLDEAYEILRDTARRERYRRAIVGAPNS